VNPWIKRRDTGIVRYTNMVPVEIEVDLPACYRVVQKLPDMYFCKEDPDGNLTWETRGRLIIEGKPFFLRATPAYSVPLDQYVFTASPVV